MRGGVSAVVYG